MDPDSPGIPPDQQVVTDDTRTARILAWAALGMAILLALAMLWQGRAHG